MSRTRWATVVLGIYLALCLLLFLGTTAMGVRSPHVDWLPVLALSLLAAPVSLALVWHLPKLSVTVVLAVYVAASFTGFGPGMLLSQWATAANSWLAPGLVDRLNGLLWLATLPLLPVLITVFPERARGGVGARLLQVELGAIALLAVLVLADDSRDGLSTASAGLAALSGVALVGAGTAAAVRLVMRARRDGALRAQLCPVAWTAASLATLYVVVTPMSLLVPDLRRQLGGPALYAAITSGLPAAIGYAILRRRLFGIHLVITRALVAGISAALVAVLYMTAVLLTARLVDLPSASRPVLLYAAAVAAFVLAPCHSALQKRVFRSLYGRRGDPLVVIRDLSNQLELSAPEDVPDQIVKSVRNALKLSWVALDVQHDARATRAAEAGAFRSNTAVETLTLTHAGDIAGKLQVQPRAGQATLGNLDRRLLQHVAAQAGPAVAATRYNTELAQSRDRLVLGREQERDRLRRDLHDGLSPSLAGIALALDAARRLLHTDAIAAEQLLTSAQSEADASWGDVRRILDDLRPPGLEELGLVTALEERGRVLSRAGLFDVTVTAPALPPLRPAVETAAYRIAVEGMTNAARHAAARHCSVHVTANDALNLTVQDDGRGFCGSPAGVGIASMHTRAAELGGELSVDSAPGIGTRLHVRLPLERHP